MMNNQTKQKSNTRGRLLCLALLLVVLAGIMGLRWRGAAELRDAGTERAPTPTAAPTAAPAAAKSEPSEAQPSSAMPTPAVLTPETQAPTAQTTGEAPNWRQVTTPGAEPARIRELSYTQKTYELVSDMVFTYRYTQEAGAATIERDIEQLKLVDPPLGEMWQGIMECWRYTNTSLPVNPDAIPDDLPQDESLAIVVLGFELQADGTMAPELQSRCELALRCAELYPRAYVVLCGGCTASVKKEISEAEVMAQWLTEKGIQRERMILETKSQTTAENATNVCRILAVSYPEIKTLLLVSSDYHVPLGTLLFTEAALIWEQEYGSRPYTVANNAAVKTPGRPDYAGTTKSAEYLWTMADPYYTW